MTTGQSWVRPSSREIGRCRKCDVVPDAAGAVGAEVREVLAHLGRVDPGQLGEPLATRRCRCRRRPSRAAPGSRAAGGRRSPRESFAHSVRNCSVLPRAAPCSSAPAGVPPDVPSYPGSCTSSQARAGAYRSTAHGRRPRVHRHRGGHAVRPGHAGAGHPLPPAPGPGLDDRPGAVRPRLGGARRRRLDRLGQRHVPALLPLRRRALRALAGAWAPSTCWFGRPSPTASRSR